MRLEVRGWAGRAFNIGMLSLCCHLHVSYYFTACSDSPCRPAAFNLKPQVRPSAHATAPCIKASCLCADALFHDQAALAAGS